MVCAIRRRAVDGTPKRRKKVRIFYMKPNAFNFATHLSIVWGVTLAVMTLIEWNSLEREPLRQEVFLPFIERDIRLMAPAGELDALDAGAQPGGSGMDLRYEVELGFNGPLFLACFFIPVGLFHGAGWLLSRLKTQ